MYSLIGAIIFTIMAIVAVLIACGLPLGEFTMGGQYRILPKKLRIISLVCVIIQIFAVIIILQTGGFIKLWFPANITRYICFFFAIYLSLNTFMNLVSKSKKEKYVMTPISLVAALCYWITAIKFMI